MSQSLNQDPEKGNLTDSRLDQPPPSPQSQRESNGGDSAEPLFTLYSKLAAEQDNNMAERWQKDAEGILIFTGLFSAVVTALAVVSIQDLRPNPQDTSSFYLEKIYQLQADPNTSISHTSIPPVDVKPPPFSPPRYAIWVNLLWFLSLVISLTCAMLATLIQQWARRYIRITQLPRRSPDKRAQIRAFFANGVDRFHVTWAVELLPTLVHLSLFIFFDGLLIFLFNINHAVFGVVVYWVALSAMIYTGITIAPIFSHDSPYYAPLFFVAWLFSSTITYFLSSVLAFQLPFHPHCTFLGSSGLDRWTARATRYHSWIFGGIEMAAEDTTSKRSSEINGCILEWTVDTLSEDDALEKFLEAIPGFYRSSVIEYTPEVQEKIQVAVGKFLNRTLSSASISGRVVERRLATCFNAADVVVGRSGFADIIRTILNGNSHGGPRPIEVLESVWGHDDRWKALMRDYFGVSEVSEVSESDPMEAMISSTTPLHTVDESSLRDAFPPITTSPHRPLQGSLPVRVNPVPSLDPDITITTQDTKEPSADSSTSTSDPHSTPAAPTCIPQQTFTPTSAFTVSPQHSTDHYVISPATSPCMSSSSSPLPPLLGNTQPASADLQSFTATSESRAAGDQTAPSLGHRSPHSTDYTPIMYQPDTGVSGSRIALDVAPPSVIDDTEN